MHGWWKMTSTGLKMRARTWSLYQITALCLPFYVLRCHVDVNILLICTQDNNKCKGVANFPCLVTCCRNLVLQKTQRKSKGLLDANNFFMKGKQAK
jgi:hypothetical protein